jgi:hypothetical protein
VLRSRKAHGTAPLSWQAQHARAVCRRVVQRWEHRGTLAAFKGWYARAVQSQLARDAAHNLCLGRGTCQEVCSLYFAVWHNTVETARRARLEHARLDKARMPALDVIQVCPLRSTLPKSRPCPRGHVIVRALRSVTAGDAPK